MCKRKTIGISSFKTHFDLRANTALSNFSTKPKYSDLSYAKIINHYLGEDTVNPTELLPEEL